MKRILIFSLAYFPRHIGGAEIAIKEITDRIDPQRYEFHMITNRYDARLPKTERIGNVIVHRIGFTTAQPNMGDLGRFPLHLNKALYQVLAFLYAVQLHRRYHFDGIWAMMAHAVGVPAALFKTSFPKVPYILTLQEGDPPHEIEHTMRWFGPFFRRAFSRADVVQSISHFLDTWGKNMGAKNIRCVIPNGVSLQLFSHQCTDAERTKTWEALKRKSGDTFLVTTSRLVHKNGIDTVIRSLALLPSSVHFAIYGEGVEEDALKTLAQDIHVSERVHFMGQVAQSELPCVLQACDIFIRPSRSEGMGNSFIEAMAAGIPVIGTPVGGIPDFLFDEERNPGKEATGYIVDPENPEDIAATIKNIMAHPQKKELVCAHARALVQARYDWSHIAAEMEHDVFSHV